MRQIQWQLFGQAAREDTIIFPAWKKNFSTQQLDEISDQFEDIEHKMFGKDGFDDAEKEINSIEGALGLADLSQFTPPSPPTQKKLIASQRYDS
jgi:hypothetical protein